MSELPKGWANCKVGDILYLKNGNAFKSTAYQEIGVPIIRISDIKDGFVSTENSICVDESLFDDRFAVNNGDVLIAMSGATTGKFGVYEGNEKVLQNQRVGNLKPHSEELTSKEFIYYLCSVLKPTIIELAYGGAQPNISSKLIEGISIPLPPLAEQERIVEKLDALFASLDVIKDKLDRIPELLKNFRQQVLTQAVTGKLTEEWREGKGLHIPKKSKLNDLGKWSGGGTPSKSKKEYWSNGSVLWITPKDMKSLFIQDSIDKITPESIEDSSAKWISSSSILIVTRSGILRRTLPVAMNTVDCTVNQDLKVLTVKKGIESKYILYSLIGLEANIRSTCMKAGTTVESIEFSFLKEYEVYLPSLEEQQEIVRRVEELFAIADRVAAQYTSLKEKIDQLPQAILAKAFRGELVEQDENDESAEVLLERIMSESRIKKMTRKTRI